MFALLTSSLILLAQAQQKGDNADGHPPLSYTLCDDSNSCTVKNTAVVLDANWRWVHNVGGYTNCYDGNSWNTQYCPSGEGGGTQCAQQCALEGNSQADYQNTYGITSTGDELRLGFVTQGSYGANIGSRTYLLSESGNSYEMFYLLNKQFEFEVDVSTLDCGLNGALYFVAMSENGDLGVGNNQAGAAYGTGYCDAQCPQDIKFISGAGNCEDWVPSSNSGNSGTGRYGACCNEMDIWEANRISNAVTPHSCSGNGLYECDSQTSSDCGNADGTRYESWCDADGCDFNPYRVGQTTFYGNSSSFTVDTTQKITVITQFLTDDGTDTGNLVEIRRFYQQNGQTWELPPAIDVNEKYNSVTDNFCLAEEEAFGDKSQFEAKGGLATMGKQMLEGMVLVMSLWDDYSVDMLWLDSCYPTDVPCTDPGVARGSCPTSSGEPNDVEANDPNAYTTFGSIALRPIQSYNNAVKMLS